MAEIHKLKRIVDIEYNDITRDSNIYHWERRHINGKIYRHDNFPDPRWRGVSTYPKHFHNGSQNNTEESRINDFPKILLIRSPSAANFF